MDVKICCCCFVSYLIYRRKSSIIEKSSRSVFIHKLVFFLCVSDFDLNAQCCTFQKTGEEYQYQHNYKCKTCDNDDWVCIVCANVCHDGHDLVYFVYDKAFCDCGPRGERSCRALTPRTSTPNVDRVEKEPTVSSSLLPRQGKYR